MKKNTHPKYQQVLFVDSATGHKFLCGSTLQPKATEEFNGKEYPVQRVSTSSASHPFFTGSKQLVDAEGRVDKFKKRYAQKPVKEVELNVEQDVQKKETSTEKKVASSPAKVKK